MNDEPPREELPRDPLTEHAELIGRVAIAWNNVHRLIGQMFEAFTESEEAKKRYWAMTSDRAQRTLALAAGAAAMRTIPDLKERLEREICAIDAMAGTRNTAIHTFWTVSSPDWKVRPHDVSPRKVRDDFVEHFERTMGELTARHLILWMILGEYHAQVSAHK
jgi:hypothetical protein